jgi:hypothetical protein
MHAGLCIRPDGLTRCATRLPHAAESAFFPGKHVARCGRRPGTYGKARHHRGASCIRGLGAAADPRVSLSSVASCEHRVTGSGCVWRQALRCSHQLRAQAQHLEWQPFRADSEQACVGSVQTAAISVNAPTQTATNPAHARSCWVGHGQLARSRTATRVPRSRADVPDLGNNLAPET